VDDVEDTFTFVEVPGAVTHIGPLEFSTARTVHSAECYAIKLSAKGRSLVYSGDAAPSAGLVELARGASLFLCEASYLDGQSNPPGVHMTGREAVEQARAAGVDRLVLTHLVPWNDRLRVLADAGATNPLGGLPIELARPGAVYDL
jgi:ribonuclease BN (tRNA processing enzyme)